MFRIVLFGLVAILTECTAFKLDGRIINGTKAEKQPWIAEILVDLGNGPTHHCGGSLIHPKWVLTAAQGFFSDMHGNKPIFPLSVYRVTVGSTTQLEGEYFNVINAEHLDFGWTEFDLTNDICLLELETAVPPSIGKPVQLPQKANPYTGQTGYAFGWGQMENGKYSEELMEGRILITDNANCTNKVSGRDPKKVCGDPAVTHSMSCSGDVGGPLAVHGDSKEFVLVGVSSFQNGNCDRVDVYTRVSEYLDWISEHTK